MADVLVRDLDTATHAELKRRAETAGVSMQTYVARLLSEHAQRPTLDQWLRRLDRLDAVPEVTGTDAVAAARDELP